MKVLLFSRYEKLGASSRVRFLQYLPYFKSQCAEVTVNPLLSDVYLKALYNGGFLWREVVLGYAKRMRALLGARQFDVVVIEKELFPFFPAFAERFLRLIGVPFVVDYDDALFHRYDCHSNVAVRRLLGRKIDAVMRQANCVIAGNNYIAAKALGVGAKRVQIIPTVVDVDHYIPKYKLGLGAPVVGWIGTPQTSRYLKRLLPLFETLKQEFSVRFVAVGANPEDFEGTSVETWPWSEGSEVESLQKFDIGIMPLVDSPWERGKCGYKLIQYLACGVPVVASPVGVNCEIVIEGNNGRLADSVEQWDMALRAMLKAEPSRLEEMGRVGREQVTKWYSLEAQAPRLLNSIIEAAREKKI